jgi:murein DD-endopeptidase MepM/ murein hydrolase activator NlpD
MIERRKAQGDKKKLLRRLRNKYRLVIMNDATFDERFSLSLTPLNVIAAVALLTLVVASTVVAVIVLTPLKVYIPGYSDTQTRLYAINAALRADSLERQQLLQIQYLEGLRRVLSGEADHDTTGTYEPAPPGTYKNVDFTRSPEDEALRKNIENEERFALTPGAALSSESIGLPGIFFFTPIRGTITSGFSPAQGHMGVDVVGPDGEAVKAVYDGTVVFAAFTSDGGNVLHIQHPNNLLSVYKHNAVLLKKVGDVVRAGQSVAIMGNTGEFTDGPHLHFELWHDGAPLNPQDFIAF